MSSKFPYAEHLLEEEVNYELKLRNYVEDLKKDLPNKQRLLRRLFHKDAKEKRDYRSPYSIEEEYESVSSRVNGIRTDLTKGSDASLISRLKHYYLRIKRSNTKDDESVKMKEKLLGNISDLLIVENALAPLLPSDTEKLDSNEESEVEESQNTDEEARSKKKTKKKVGFSVNKKSKVKKNEGKSKKEVKNDKEEAQLKARIAVLESQLEAFKLFLSLQQGEVPQRLGDLPTGSLANSSQNQNPNRIPGNRQSRQGSHPIPTGNSHGQGHNQRNEGRRRTGNQGSGSGGNPGGNGDSREDYTQSSEEDDGVGWDNPQWNRRGYREDRTHYDRKIEKWNLSFSGDSRSPSVEDFLFKVKALASMNSVPSEQVLSNIHLLLRGEASNWFFTYYQPSWTWEIFETRIRFRFGNPNQEQGNRQRIFDRKQQKGETFIAFVTEIERLNKLLAKRLSNRRKFEIIWENMRQHYRSKLACFAVENLDQLIQLNYRIDANDPSLHPVGQRHSVHNIEEQEEESEEEEINVVGKKSARGQNQSREPERDGRQRRDDRRDETRQPLCWNCRQHGHFWRDCQEQKTTFCYICGNQGKISTTCDKHPRRNQQNQTGESAQASGN